MLNGSYNTHNLASNVHLHDPCWFDFCVHWHLISKFDTFQHLEGQTCYSVWETTVLGNIPSLVTSDAQKREVKSDDSSLKCGIRVYTLLSWEWKPVIKARGNKYKSITADASPEEEGWTGLRQQRAERPIPPHTLFLHLFGEFLGPVSLCSSFSFQNKMYFCAGCACSGSYFHLF